MTSFSLFSPSECRLIILCSIVFFAVMSPGASTCREVFSNSNDFAQSSQFFIMQEQDGYGPGFPFSSLQEHEVFAREAWSKFFDGYFVRGDFNRNRTDLIVFFQMYRYGRTSAEIADELGLADSYPSSISRRIIDRLNLFRRHRPIGHGDEKMTAARELMEFLRYERGLQ